MKNSVMLLLLLIASQGRSQMNDLFVDRFTGINPVSYTDVVYIGEKDTVLVSTYSGRIARIINGQDGETILAQVGDEIYALAYNPIQQEILASTLLNGILVLDAGNGKLLRKISLAATWANTIGCSDDFRYLYAHDQKGQLHSFDMQNNYTRIKPDSSVPPGRIIQIDAQNRVNSISPKKLTIWELHSGKIIKQSKLDLARFADRDSRGNILSIDFNTCKKWDANTQANTLELAHPNWPLPNPENESEVFEIPYQMQLNAAKFARNKIYTAGIDRSVRVWDKESGQLLQTLNGHKGSISKLKVSPNQSQVVSVDLKGAIRFWEVE
jgi:WD40 repeat protein